MLAASKTSGLNGLSYKIFVPSILASITLEMVYRVSVGVKSKVSFALFTVYSLYIIIMVIGVCVPLMFYAWKLRTQYKKSLALLGPSIGNQSGKTKEKQNKETESISVQPLPNDITNNNNPNAN